MTVIPSERCGQHPICLAANSLSRQSYSPSAAGSYSCGLSSPPDEQLWKPYQTQRREDARRKGSSFRQSRFLLTGLPVILTRGMTESEISQIIIDAAIEAHRCADGGITRRVVGFFIHVRLSSFIIYNFYFRGSLAQTTRGVLPRYGLYSTYTTIFFFQTEADWHGDCLFYQHMVARETRQTRENEKRRWTAGEPTVEQMLNVKLRP